MCGFTFTVFLSAFQLLPTAPFRIQELGGSTFASGLFLGFLTYASAGSAPLTGAIADRIGRRRTLIIASCVILLCAIGYGVTTSYPVMLAIVLVHGVFWSGLLSASAAYLTHLLPERRRAEGISYWGLSSVAAIAVAPPVAFWIMQHGGWLWICISCGTLNLLMGAIAFSLPEDRLETQMDLPLPEIRPALVEWRVLVLSLTLFLYSFSYGAITSFSAMYADALGISPKSIYLTMLAIVILLTRPLSGALPAVATLQRPDLVAAGADVDAAATAARRRSSPPRSPRKMCPSISPPSVTSKHSPASRCARRSPASWKNSPSTKAIWSSRDRCSSTSIVVRSRPRFRWPKRTSFATARCWRNPRRSSRAMPPTPSICS